VLAIGAHVDSPDPVGAARDRGADLTQFFLADPQGWAKPEPPADAPTWRSSRVDLYVHAPYVINVATRNNRIRIPSRKLLDQHAEAAAGVGALALIVHGGHVGAGDDPAEGFANWRKTVERIEPPLPILIENTAGGGNAMARSLDGIARLWYAIGDLAASPRFGFCLDTCHAHAAGEDLVDIVERVRAITGRIDLVHANDSRDPFGSGRDRHENLGAGQIDPKALLAVVEAAGAPVVCETPGGVAGQTADIEFLRAHLPA
jgi:deoxyribonuclease IV